MTLRTLLVALAFAASLATIACSTGKSERTRQPVTPATSGAVATASITTGTTRNATVRGVARLEGTPLDVQWIGAVVRFDGLVTPCQVDLPPIKGGQFAVTVFAAGQSAGCGRSGAEIVLWTYVGDQRLFALKPIPWPTTDDVAVEVGFSRSFPLGAATEIRDLFGAVFDSKGSPMPPGTRVEAFVSNTLCGVASVRSGVFDGYVISIVGADARPGCQPHGAVTFRVDGKRAVPSRDSSVESREPIDLTVE